MKAHFPPEKTSSNFIYKKMSIKKKSEKMSSQVIFFFIYFEDTCLK
jgi:hypothetical protein